MSEYCGHINISLNAVLRRTEDNPDMTRSLNTFIHQMLKYNLKKNNVFLGGNDLTARTERYKVSPEGVGRTRTKRVDRSSDPLRSNNLHINPKS